LAKIQQLMASSGFRGKLLAVPQQKRISGAAAEGAGQSMRGLSRLADVAGLTGQRRLLLLCDCVIGTSD
jgi:hypothetical protein